MKILEIRPVLKSDIAVKRNAEVVPKSYFNAVFQLKDKTYTATIRISTNHIAHCINENNQAVNISKETEEKLIAAINEYNKNNDS